MHIHPPAVVHAILHHGKDIENRTWRTNYRGPILIHASNTEAEGSFDFDIPEFLDYGAIVGTADLVDCVTKSKSKWFHGPYGFVLKNVREIEPIECKGKLGIWEVNYELQLRTI